MLPDGTVLILGGIDANGNVNGTAEEFDPKTRQFSLLPPIGLTPRAYHTATLLTNGNVLIVGGVSEAHGNKPTGTTSGWLHTGK